MVFFTMVRKGVTRILNQVEKAVCRRAQPPAMKRLISRWRYFVHIRRLAGHTLPVVELVRVKPWTHMGSATGGFSSRRTPYAVITREQVTHEIVTFTVLSRRRYILYNDLRKWKCRSSYFSWLTCTRPAEVGGQREGEVISCRSPKPFIGHNAHLTPKTQFIIFSHFFVDILQIRGRIDDCNE
jgi:hypothetical protein